jgi:hypothetical protein
LSRAAAVFFPEKRDFFLENSGQFTVGNQGNQRMADLFFSRRIGLSETGQLRSSAARG